MALEGKGYFIWQIAKTEDGNPVTIANKAVEAGLSHVLIKIADGIHTYNVDLVTGQDLVGGLVQQLRARGILVYGWHYVYGYYPEQEADIAIQRIRQHNLDGYVIDAESEYKDTKNTNRYKNAKTFMSRLRAALPNLPIALSSYRYPSLHPTLPWMEFLEKCDFNMPQVYWLQNHNPGDQLRRCVNEFQNMTPFRPIIPTGAAFREHGWEPTVADVIQFMDTARELNLKAANYWEWRNCRVYLPHVWDAIADYNWYPGVRQNDITMQYINALNSHNVDAVLALYTSSAVHVTASRTVQGQKSLRDWYTHLLTRLLPNATFNLTGYTGSGVSRTFTWTAKSSAGSVLNGNDTFGLSGTKVAYHFTSFTIN